MTGTIKWFNTNRGFGFIATENGDDLFVHVSDVKTDSPIVEGMKVKFEVGTGERGRFAQNVEVGA